MPFGIGTNTPSITTGNVRTTYNPYTPPALAATAAAVGPPFNGLANPLGTIFVDVGGPDSVSGTATQLPALAACVYKYVLYKSATNPALLAGPAPVYYTDNTFTIVSGTLADGLTGKNEDIAGLMMVNTADLSGITATILNNATNGSGVWIAINGYVKGAAIGALTIATGDWMAGTTGNFISTNTADGAAAPTLRKFYATATSASAANKADMMMTLSYDV